MDPSLGVPAPVPPTGVGHDLSRSSTATAGASALLEPRGRRVAASRRVAPAPPAAPRTFDVRDFGGIGDGTADDTAALARTIDACADAGGGRVLVPAGRWLVGAIVLRDRVDLHVAAAAVLRFDAEPSRYLPAVPLRHAGRACVGYAPMIYASGRSDVSITGSGTLVGGGAGWWAWAKDEPRLAAALHRAASGDATAHAGAFRPPLIGLFDCRRVLVSGVTVQGAGPACTIRLAGCAEGIVRDVRLRVADGPDNDGIVLEDCRDSRVERCDVESAGHAVRVGPGGARVTVTDVRVRSERGDGVSIRGDGATADVAVRAIRVGEARHAVAVQCVRGWGGRVERLDVEDVSIDQARGAAISIGTEPPPFAGATGGLPPGFDHLAFRRIACARAAHAVTVNGLPDQCVRDLSLADVDVCADEGLTCTSAREVSLRDVRVTPTFGPDLSLRDVRDVRIEGIRHDRVGGTFLDLRGRRTTGIRIHTEAGGRVRPSIVLGADVPREAIEHL